MTNASKRTKNQKITTEYRMRKDGKEKCRAFIRYDDECGNGHNTFSITGETRELYNGRWHEGSGGCIHETVAEYFPEYAPFIKWHSVSSDAPMYYIENTVYHAGNRDCWGKLKGEPKSYKTVIKFGNFTVTFKMPDNFTAWLEKLENYDLTIASVPYIERAGNNYKFQSKYTFLPFALEEWHKAPFDTLEEAQQFLEALKKYPPQYLKEADSFGEGKEREFDAARSSAIWPEATDEQLSLPKEELTALLMARHENLMNEFYKAMLELGFTF